MALVASIISYNQQIDPEGRVIFTEQSSGPCGVFWGYAPGGNDRGYTSDAYIETGLGLTITFGSMLYHKLEGVLTNIINEDNETKILWPLKERTLVNIKWQHERLIII